MVNMPGIKRDYKIIVRYLKKYGKGPQILPLMKISREYQDKGERFNKYKEHIDNLIRTGQINLNEVYKKERSV
jgi:hypothetical protein